MRDEADADVMRDREGAGLDFQRRDPGVLGESARHDVVGPFQNALGGNIVLWAFYDIVRLDLPTVGRPLDRRRRILRIAFFGSAVGPRHDGVDLTLLQGAIVGKVTVL